MRGKMRGKEKERTELDVDLLGEQNELPGQGDGVNLLR